MPPLFSHHALAVSGFCTDSVAKPNSWAVIVLCALLFFLTISVVLFRRRLSYVFKSLYSQRFYSLLLRESKVLEDMMFPVVLLYDLLTVSLGTLMIVEHFYAHLVQKTTYFGMFGIIFAIMLALYFLTFTANIVYTGLFEHQKERYSLNLYKFIFLTNVAIVLFPFLIAYQATGYFVVLYAFIPVFLALWGLFLYRIMKINPRNINLFQFFLYFCTLEVLPYLLLVKLLTKF